MAVLVVPVSLQIFSRYTELIPAYIWTEEMARFLFVWMIMLGAMLGSGRAATSWWTYGRDGVAGASRAADRVEPVRAGGRAGVRRGGASSSPALRIGRISELAELPLWLIHVAWPLAGATWIVFLGEQFYDDLHTALGRAQ